MGKAIHLRGTKEYPDFDAFFGGYFHQDFDIFGNSIEEIIQAFKNDVANEPEILDRVRNDIERFLAVRPVDQTLAEDVESFFAPGVLPEGWEPDITNWRQWLTRVAQLLEAPKAPQK